VDGVIHLSDLAMDTVRMVTDIADMEDMATEGMALSATQITILITVVGLQLPEET